MLDFFGVQFKRVFGEPETLLNERSQLANAASLLAKNFLGVGGADNDLVRRCEHCRGGIVICSTSVRA